MTFSEMCLKFSKCVWFLKSFSVTDFSNFSQRTQFKCYSNLKPGEWALFLEQRTQHHIVYFHGYTCAGWGFSGRGAWGKMRLGRDVSSICNIVFLLKTGFKRFETNLMDSIVPYRKLLGLDVFQSLELSRFLEGNMVHVPVYIIPVVLGRPLKSNTLIYLQ